MSGIVFLVIFAGAMTSAFIAGSKNRNAVGWFFAGALLPLISVMLLAIAPALPPPEH